MSEIPIPPGARFGLGSGDVVRDDVPEEARRALLVVYAELVRRKYLRSWRPVLRELERIARVPPSSGRASEDQERFFSLLVDVAWTDVLYLIERTYDSHLQAVIDRRWGKEEIVASHDEVRLDFEAEVRRILVEEALALEFNKGRFERPGRPQTQQAAARATHTLAASELDDARRHFVKALSFFSAVPDPDYENAVKEAVQALESAAKHLYPDLRKKGFDQLISALQGTEEGEIPPALGKVIKALFAFRGSGKGISHGGATGGVVTREVAEFVLASAGAAITYLAQRRLIEEKEIPF